MFPLLRHLLTILALAAICVAHSTGSGSSELDRRIERQVRDYAGLAPNAVITLGGRQPSRFAGYDELLCTSADRYPEFAREYLAWNARFPDIT